MMVAFWRTRAKAGLVWMLFAGLLLAASTQTFMLREPRLRDTFGEQVSPVPTLWLPVFRLSPERLVQAQPVNTGLSLIWFALAAGLVELALGYGSVKRGDRLVRPLVRAAAVFLVLWSFLGYEPVWDFLLGLLFPRSPQLLHPSLTIIQFASQHLELLLVSSCITVPLGLLIGILLTRESFEEFLPLISNVISSGQTVPTLAVIAIVAPVIGFGFWPAIFALTLYGLLPVVRNTIAGLESVDSFIVESAQGMGMTPAQTLLRIELPIASPIILAGIRTSVVINVGTAALGAFIGSGGLGVPIASGLSMTIDPFVLLGALPAALIAVLLDYVLGTVEAVLTPHGLMADG